MDLQLTSRESSQMKSSLSYTPAPMVEGWALAFAQLLNAINMAALDRELTRNSSIIGPKVMLFYGI